MFLKNTYKTKDEYKLSPNESDYLQGIGNRNMMYSYLLLTKWRKERKKKMKGWSKEFLLHSEALTSQASPVSWKQESKVRHAFPDLGHSTT